MSWYVRSFDNERLDVLMTKVAACFEAASIATGCSYEIKQHGHTYRNMVVDSVLANLYAANSKAVGRPMPFTGDVAPRGGSTDMGNVSHVVPSIHPMLDINSLPAVNHQPEFAAHTITPDGDKAIDDGALAMAGTIIDLAQGDR